MHFDLRHPVYRVMAAIPVRFLHTHTHKRTQREREGGGGEREEESMYGSSSFHQPHFSSLLPPGDNAGIIPSTLEFMSRFTLLK